MESAAPAVAEKTLDEATEKPSRPQESLGSPQKLGDGGKLAFPPSAVKSGSVLVPAEEIKSESALVSELHREPAVKSGGDVHQEPAVKSDWEVAPWDQHAGLLKMARFDYRREELLRSGNGGGIQGFLITCAFRREKSATSEALSILPKYLPALCARAEGSEAEALGGEKEGLGGGVGGAVVAADVADEGKGKGDSGGDSKGEEEGETSAKRQRTETGGEGAALREKVGGVEAQGEDSGRRFTQVGGEEGIAPKVATEKEEDSGKKVSKTEEDASAAEDALKAGLGAVKLGSMGITFLALPEKEKCVPGSKVPCPVDVVGQILKDIQEKKRTGLKWCQRICPVQATCPTTKRHLSAAVQRLLANHFAATPATAVAATTTTPQPAAATTAAAGSVEAHRNGSETATELADTQPHLPPVQFAVAFKKRGAEDVAATAKESAKKEEKEAGRREGDEGSLGKVQGNGGEEGEEGKVGEGDLVLSRDVVIRTVADAVKEAAGKRGAVANLTDPEFAIVVEIVPLARGPPFCAVSILPRSMLDTKPRLAVKTVAASTGGGAENAGGSGSAKTNKNDSEQASKGKKGKGGRRHGKRKRG
ncbi:hypothetical protein CLOM_g18849 [Closterium sp. NIES-68]|nr:hypothetical protein CLOM_g18849 [Closterium sp. NIES-68]